MENRKVCVCVYLYVYVCLCMSVCRGGGGQGGGARTEFGIPWRDKHAKEATAISILAQHKCNGIIKVYTRASNSVLFPHSWCNDVVGRSWGARLKAQGMGWRGPGLEVWGHHTALWEWAENGHEVVSWKWHTEAGCHRSPLAPPLFRGQGRL